MEDLDKIISEGLVKIMATKDWSNDKKLEFIRAVTILLERNKLPKVESVTNPQVLTRNQTVVSTVNKTEDVNQITQRVTPQGAPQVLKKTNSQYGGKRFTHKGIVYECQQIFDDNTYFQITDIIGNELDTPKELTDEEVEELGIKQKR